MLVVDGLLRAGRVDFNLFDAELRHALPRVLVLGAQQGGARLLLRRRGVVGGRLQGCDGLGVAVRASGGRHAVDVVDLVVLQDLHVLFVIQLGDAQALSLAH